MPSGEYYDRSEDVQPGGRIYIRLTCGDCHGEVRLAKSAAGEERAQQMIREHKPSGCCQDRQDANARAAARDTAA